MSQLVDMTARQTARQCAIGDGQLYEANMKHVRCKLKLKVKYGGCQNGNTHISTCRHDSQRIPAGGQL